MKCVHSDFKWDAWTPQCGLFVFVFQSTVNLYSIELWQWLWTVAIFCFEPKIIFHFVSMTTTLRLLFNSNIRQQTELGYISWMDEKKTLKGCRTSNLVVITEMLQVEPLFCTNSEHYVRWPALPRIWGLTDLPQKLQFHLPLACWLFIKMDGSISEINPSYLARPPPRMASSIYSLMFKCFLTSLIPSLLFPFLHALSSLRGATCLLQPISSERDRDTFSFHWCSKWWIHLLRNTFFLSVCLFVGGPREMAYIGRALTRCRCMQMSTTLNWNPHSIILGCTSGNSKVELLWPGARLREKERRKTTDGGGRRRYATFHTTDGWSDLHQFLPYSQSLTLFNFNNVKHRGGCQCERLGKYAGRKRGNSPTNIVWKLF